MAGRSKRRRWRAREGAVVEPRPRLWFGANVEHQRNRGEESAAVTNQGGCRRGREGVALPIRVRRRPTASEERSGGGDGELQHCPASHPPPPSPSATRRRCGLFLARGSVPAARAGRRICGSVSGVSGHGSSRCSSAGPSPVPQPRHDGELAAPGTPPRGGERVGPAPRRRPCQTPRTLIS
jgi:hypothetical protein